MKTFWSWQSDTPGKIGRFLVRDALNEAIDKLRSDSDVEEAPRDIHLDHDVKDVPGSPDLVRTILAKIEKSEVVVADVTIVGKTEEGKGLINSNVAIELGYAFHACTDERAVLVFNKHYGKYEELPFDLRPKGGGVLQRHRGRTWKESRHRPAGYRWCVAIVPDTPGPTAFAVGPTGMDYSIDRGKNWKRINEVDANRIAFADPRHGWAVGQKGVILEFEGTVPGGTAPSLTK